MRVLVLTPYPYGTVAGPRSSFELWERALAPAGITLDYCVFESARLSEIIYQPGHTLEKARELARSFATMVPRALRGRDYDAVLINREAALIGPAVIERLLARTRVPLIYLLDDPLYIPYRSPSNGLASYLKCFGKVGTLCRISAAVIANSPSNAGFAARHNANVWEIPSVVDAELYTGWERRTPDPAGGDRVCIGWSGSASTAANLQVIRHPLAELGARDDVTLRFIGAADFGMPEVAHEALPWRADTEVAELRRLDIGVVPLPLTRWTPHKFYLKLVQYMALGIPAVATPLGSNPVVIEHGVNGFLAGSDPAWSATLEELVADPALREQVGRRAAETAHRRYTLQANTERVLAAFRSALA